MKLVLYWDTFKNFHFMDIWTSEETFFYLGSDGKVVRRDKRSTNLTMYDKWGKEIIL